MPSVRSVLAVLAIVLSIAAAQAATAQEYVSCVRCHALSSVAARAQLDRHGVGSPPNPEAACGICHATMLHELDPGVPPPQPYFWPYALVGPGSLMTNLCLSCHTAHDPYVTHPNDVFPFFDATPPTWTPTAPTSVLPLYDFAGSPLQDPYAAGLVCSTCHDPHEPAYPVNGLPKFLRVGDAEDTLPLCTQCHVEGAAPSPGEDLVISSRSDSVSFQRQPDGSLHIFATIENRGNIPSPGASVMVWWEEEPGNRVLAGPLFVPAIAADGAASTSLSWMPHPGWAATEGRFVFELPPRPLNPAASFEFVRAIAVPPAPQNLRVASTSPTSIDLVWESYQPPYAGPPLFDVYRDGVKINAWPLSAPCYTDSGLAPETPHVYTVVSVGADGFASAPSNAAGGTTLVGTVIRVPNDYPTIQSAIAAATAGTSVHVAAGTYTEPFSIPAGGVTVKGQDANSCVLDYRAVLGGGVDMLGGASGSTLAGFTILQGQVHMNSGDVLSGCVLWNESIPPVVGGGLVVQCVAGSTSTWAVSIEPFQFLASVNSLYLTSQPFQHVMPPAAAALLISNDFAYAGSGGWDWADYPGSGNFAEYPAFPAPGPPSTFLMEPFSATVDRGLPLGTPYGGALPDLGAYEVGLPCTPKPPSNLSAAFDSSAGAISLTWSISVDDPVLTGEYWIYRSADATFPPGAEFYPYATVSAGTWSFTDTAITKGVRYSYQVRAFGGFPLPPGLEPLLSAATNTAADGDLNEAPAPVDDTAQTPEDQAVVVAVLGNDGDPNGDPLAIDSLSQPSHGTASLNPDNTVTYTPAPDFFGIDSFAYTVTDGRGGYATASVVVDVLPVNDAPVAGDDAYATAEDQTLVVSAPGLLGNDGDVEADPLSVEIVSWPLHGALVAAPDGSFIYAPAANHSGSDSFTYRVSDGAAFSNVATVTIAVTAVNDAPVADAGPDKGVRINAATAFSGSGSTDVDGTIVSYSWNFGDGTTASGMTVSKRYKKTGTYVVTLTVTDDQGATGTDSAQVTVTR